MTAPAPGPASVAGSTGTWRAAAAVIALLSAACGAPLARLPAGPGTPATDTADAMAQATLACRAVSAITAEVGITGSINGRRLRARLLVGLAPPASARLEAFALSQQIFIFVSRAGDATLLLPREGRVLEHGPAGDVLEAVTGVPIDAAELRLALLGCPAAAADGVAGRRIGDEWRVVTDGSKAIYLRRAAAAAPWRLIAVVYRPAGRPEWRAEYRDFVNGLPNTIRLVSTEPQRFDLRLALSQVETNVPLEPAVFEVKIPPAMQPMDLAELRANGPLSDAR